MDVYVDKLHANDMGRWAYIYILYHYIILLYYIMLYYIILCYIHVKLYLEATVIHSYTYIMM